MNQKEKKGIRRTGEGSQVPEKKEKGVGNPHTFYLVLEYRPSEANISAPHNGYLSIVFGQETHSASLERVIGPGLFGPLSMDIHSVLCPHIVCNSLYF